MSGAVENAPAAGPRVTAWGWRAYGVALVVLALDQLSKWWVLSVLRLPEQASLEIVWPLQLTRIWNQGVSFGLLQAQQDLVRWGLVAFSLAVAAMLAAWARTQTRWLPALGLAFIMGGAVGNAIDRARFGAVVDFIDVQRIGFFPWIFNVADSGITVGVVLLLVDSLLSGRGD